MNEDYEVKHFYYDGKNYNIPFPISGIRDDGICFVEFNGVIYYKLGGLDYYRPAYLAIENVFLYCFLCVEED